MFAPGVVAALNVCIQAMTEYGEGIIIQNPVYYPFAKVIGHNKRKVINNQLIRGSDGRYHMDFADLEIKAARSDVTMMVLCSPHNPVSRVWSRNELIKVLDICKNNDVILVSDEIHMDLTRSDYKHIPAASIDKKYNDIIVHLSAPSKTFNIPGLNCSEVYITNPKLRQKYKRQHFYNSMGTRCIVASEAAKAAYTYGSEWVDKLNLYLDGNVDLVSSYLARNIPDVKLIPAEATYLLWLDFSALKFSENELFKRFINEGLAMSAGSVFGENDGVYFRLNVGTQRKRVESAMKMIEKAIKK